MAWPFLYWRKMGGGGWGRVSGRAAHGLVRAGSTPVGWAPLTVPRGRWHFLALVHEEAENQPEEVIKEPVFSSCVRLYF